MVGSCLFQQRLNSAPPAQWYFLPGNSQASTRASWDEPLSVGPVVPMRRISFGAATRMARQMAWSVAGGHAVGLAEAPMSSSLVETLSRTRPLAMLREASRTVLSSVCSLRQDWTAHPSRNPVCSVNHRAHVLRRGHLSEMGAYENGHFCRVASVTYPGISGKGGSWLRAGC